MTCKSKWQDLEACRPRTSYEQIELIKSVLEVSPALELSIAALNFADKTTNTWLALLVDWTGAHRA